jgi:hypothetical protein
MKKRIVLFILLFALFIFIPSFVISDDNVTQPQNSSAIPSINGHIGDIGKGLNEKTQDVLEQPVTFAPLFSPVRSLLGLTSETTWKQFIVLVSVFFMIFMFLLSISDLIPFLGNNTLVKVFVSLVITCLISITHGVLGVVNFFLRAIDMFLPKNNWDVFDVVIAVILALALAFILNLIVNKFKKGGRLLDAERMGISIGAAAYREEKKAKDDIS